MGEETEAAIAKIAFANLYYIKKPLYICMYVSVCMYKYKLYKYLSSYEGQLSSAVLQEKYHIILITDSAPQHLHNKSLTDLYLMQLVPYHVWQIKFLKFKMKIYFPVGTEASENSGQDSPGMMIKPKFFLICC